MRKILLPLLVGLSLCSQAQTNNALSFNGTSTLVPIGTPLGNNSSYTKEAWVYATTSTGPRNIMSSQNIPFWIDNGVLKAGQAGVYDLVNDISSFPVNAWVHVAVTYDAATSAMKLYRNGALVSTATVAAYVPETIYIGSHFGTASFFQGNMDEIRLWSRALSQTEILAGMLKGVAVNASGLIDYYNCNSNSGSTLFNSCTNAGGSNGTITSGSWTASPVAFATNALNFDGSNDYVDLGNSSTLHITGNITVEIMANAANWSPGTEQELVSCTETGGYSIYLQGGYVRFAVRASGGSVYRQAIYAASNLTANTWYHLSGTYDGRYVKLYVDGVLVATDDIGTTGHTITYTYPNNNMMLGAEASSGTAPVGNYFPGTLDEFRLWNVAKTQAEIQSGIKREIDASTATGLIAYHNFNQGYAAGANTNLVSLIDAKGSFPGTMVGFSLATGSASNFVSQPSYMWALPLTWQSFTAQEQSGDVLLQWTTTNELNTQDFIVQHSTDGINYTAAGNVAASGTAGKASYRFVHTGAANGINYYRILQRDNDGQQSFSMIRTLQIGKQTVPFVIKNNPVVNGTLLLQVNEPVKLQIMGNSGNLLFNKSVETGSLQLDVSQYAKGVYWIKAGAYSKKVLIQ